MNNKEFIGNNSYNNNLKKYKNFKDQIYNSNYIPKEGNINSKLDISECENTLSIMKYKFYYKDKLLNLSYCDKLDFLLKLVNNEKNISQKEFSSIKENKNEIQNKNAIYLGECKYKLKEKYNISDNKQLLIYKKDLVTDYAALKIKYLVYSQNKSQLVLKYCNDAKILINTQKLDNFELIKDLINNEKDLYNQNKSFFNDRYNIKNINEFDILLSLRKELFFQDNFFMKIIVNMKDLILVMIR